LVWPVVKIAANESRGPPRPAHGSHRNASVYQNVLTRPGTAGPPGLPVSRQGQASHARDPPRETAGSETSARVCKYRIAGLDALEHALLRERRPTRHALA